MSESIDIVSANNILAIVGIDSNTMATIFQVHDDVTFAMLRYTTPLDFLSLSQTCLHFHNLSDPQTYFQVLNKYWQMQCHSFWGLIQKNNYHPQNYNYKHLFESMVDFIVSTNGHFWGWGSKPNINCNYKEKDKLKKQAYNMDITVNKIFSNMSSDHQRLSDAIIRQDNLEMFTIYTYHMSDDEINSILFPVIRSSSDTRTKIANYL